MSQEMVHIEKVVGESANSEQVRAEEFVLSGDQVVAKVKSLIHEGNIRRLTLQAGSGKTLLDLPLTVGLAGVVAGAIFAPTLLFIATLAAIFTRLKVTVERVEAGNSV
jgi:hypothetical protein